MSKDDAISRKPNCIDCIHKSVCFRLDMRVDSDYAEKCGDFLTELPSATQKSETVTEFADRCRECGARYGKLLEHKSGHWISHYDEDEKVGWYECDRCHTERAFNTRFCPDCGARMVEPQESEEQE